MAVLSALAGVVAARWIPSDAAWIWLVIDASALGAAYLFAGKLLDADEGHCAIRRWRWIFVSAETLQGILWAVIVWLIGEYGDPAARSFGIVLFLLVAAMNATISAAIPSAVIGALMPLTLVTLGFLRPASLSDGILPLIGVACGTQLYFMFLARNLHTASFKSLAFQAQKDELIAELEQAKAQSDLARHRLKLQISPSPASSPR
jgi:two-component system, cell cycle sensor histidine kinase PleC